MFVLFTHKEYGMPTIVNKNSLEYPDFILSNAYNREYEGTKAECLEMQKEILENLLIND